MGITVGILLALILHCNIICPPWYGIFEAIPPRERERSESEGWQTELHCVIVITSCQTCERD